METQISAFLPQKPVKNARCSFIRIQIVSIRECGAVLRFTCGEKGGGQVVGEEKSQKKEQKINGKGAIETEQLVAIAGVLAVAISDNLTEVQLATVTNLLQLITANLFAITAQRGINNRQEVVLPETTLFL